MKRRSLRVLVTVLLLAIIAYKVDWGELGKTVAQVSAMSVAVALLIYVAAQLISSVRWAVLAGQLGVAQPLGQYIRLYWIGMFCNLFLPTSVGGDVVRAYRLGTISGRPRDAACSVLADRLSGLAMLLVMASFALALVPTGIPEWLRWTIWPTTLLAAFGALACPRLPAGLLRLPGMRWVTESVTILMTRTGAFLWTTALSLAVQGLNVVLVWRLGESLGLAVPAGFYWILVPTVSLLTMLPVSLNGMGVREGATVLLLTPYGVSAGQGLTLAVLWFIVVSAVSLSGAGFYLAGPTETRSAPASVDYSDLGASQC
jgi:uncharacterized membrane protein YbhN (UPF0104 family)